jgi:hypothetical protein
MYGPLILAYRVDLGAPYGHECKGSTDLKLSVRGCSGNFSPNFIERSPQRTTALRASLRTSMRFDWLAVGSLISVSLKCWSIGILAHCHMVRNPYSLRIIMQEYSL